MDLIRASSPHAHVGQHTAGVMQRVLVATTPGVMALTAAFGPGTLLNILLACTTGLLLEAAVIRVRKRPVLFYLRDCSALVTATLLAISMPPYSPWWLILIGMIFAIVVAKHCYGGLGYNPFNPAMVGYVVLLISFPVEMTRWTAPVEILTNNKLSITEGLMHSLGVLDPARFDAITMATPLDLFRNRSGQQISELWQAHAQFGHLGGAGWELAGAGFLLGGTYLLYRRIITWHAPVSMLGSIVLLSALFYDHGSSRSAGSPLFHLFSGATLFGAFFIVTDPVTSAVSKRGRLVFGAGTGVLVFVIRRWGNYPDSVAFAVLLMNFAAPFIDHFTQPRTYGHKSD